MSKWQKIRPWIEDAIALVLMGAGLLVTLWIVRIMEGPL